MAHAIDYIYFVTCISVVAYRVVVGTSVSVGHPNFRGAKCVMHLVDMQGVKALKHFLYFHECKCSMKETNIEFISDNSSADYARIQQRIALTLCIYFLIFTVSFCNLMA